MTTVLLYAFSCELTLSENCQSLSNRILATKSTLLHVKSPNTKSLELTKTDIILPGGTFYRHSFLNRNKVERNVNKLVEELRNNRLLEMREQRLLREERELRLEELMEADLDDIELETWNLDNYYHMPRTPKDKTPISVQKQPNAPIPDKQMKKTLSQIETDSLQQTISKELKLKSEDEFVSSRETDLEDSDKEDYDEIMDLDSKHLESKTLEPVFTENVAPKKKQKIILNSNGEIVKKIAPSNEIDKKKAKKNKKKPQKVIPILPDTFPYFETGHPPAKTDTHTCR